MFSLPLDLEFLVIHLKALIPSGYGKHLIVFLENLYG